MLIRHRNSPCSHMISWFCTHPRPPLPQLPKRKAVRPLAKAPLPAWGEVGLSHRDWWRCECDGSPYAQFPPAVLTASSARPQKFAYPGRCLNSMLPPLFSLRRKVTYPPIVGPLPRHIHEKALLVPALALHTKETHASHMQITSQPQALNVQKHRCTTKVRIERQQSKQNAMGA